MKLARAEQMREIDRRAIEEFGIPGIVLMENAGLAVTRELAAMLRRNSVEGLRGVRACILCGPGNNGGDGFVVARHLANLGGKPDVTLLAEASKLKGDSLTNLNVLEAMGPGVVPLRVTEDGLDGLSPAESDELQRAFSRCDVVVDAIFGTGFLGELPEGVRAVAELVRVSGKPTLSIDMPSGVSSDDCKVAHGAMRANVTVTFALSKVGLEVYPGKPMAGRVVRAYIGIPPVLLSSPTLTVNQLSEQEACRLLPVRRQTDHKGTYGRTAVIAGSPGMTGAAYLVATAAVRVGSGLVTLCIPRSLNAILEVKTTEAMTCPCSETELGTFAGQALGAIMEQVSASTSVVVGPGLGRHAELRELMAGLIASSEVPVLVDADGLNHLDVGALASRPNPAVPVVLTPHPGELARMLGCSIADVEGDRLGIAVACAKEWGAYLVLKGASTVVAGPDGLTYINPTGNPGMATGGTGDVLSGIIGGLLAQGVKPLDACAVGTFVHGLAGDIAADEVGMASLAAGDLLGHLPRALVKLEAWRAEEMTPSYESRHGDPSPY